MPGPDKLADTGLELNTQQRERELETELTAEDQQLIEELFAESLQDDQIDLDLEDFQAIKEIFGDDFDDAMRHFGQEDIKSISEVLTDWSHEKDELISHEIDLDQQELATLKQLILGIDTGGQSPDELTEFRQAEYTETREQSSEQAETTQQEPLSERLQTALVGSDFEALLQSSNIEMSRVFAAMGDKMRATLGSKISTQFYSQIETNDAFGSQEEKLDLARQIGESAIGKLNSTRTDNITFVLLKDLRDSIEEKIVADDLPYPDQLKQKAMFFTALKNSVGEGGADISELQQVLLRYAGYSDSDVQRQQQGFDTFINQLLIAEGLPLNDEKALSKMIREEIKGDLKEDNQKRRKLDVDERVGAHREATETVIGESFDAFDYFDSYTAVEEMNSQINSGKDNFVSLIQKHAESPASGPSDEQLGELVADLETIAQDIPSDEEQQAQLTRKLTNDGVDSMLEQFGWVYDILGENIKENALFQSLLNMLFGKKLGTEDVVGMIEFRKEQKELVDTYGQLAKKEKQRSWSQEELQGLANFTPETNYFTLGEDVYERQEGVLKNPQGEELAMSDIIGEVRVDAFFDAFVARYSTQNKQATIGFGKDLLVETDGEIDLAATKKAFVKDHSADILTNDPYVFSQRDLLDELYARYKREWSTLDDSQKYTEQPEQVAGEEKNKNEAEGGEVEGNQETV